jgi:hypothetical protein
VVSANGFRIVALNGLAILAVGIMVGFPVVLAVGREFYHYPQPINLPGAFSAWLSAHVVCLMNGLVVIAVAEVTRLKPMTERAERPVILGLLVAGWGNTIGSVAAILFGVIGVELSWNIANDVIVVMFGFAAMGIIYAVGASIHHLWRPIES